MGLTELCEFFLSYAGEYSCPGVNPGLTGIDLWIPGYRQEFQVLTGGHPAAGTA